MREHATEFGASVESVGFDKVYVEVVMLIRGARKVCRSADHETIESVRSLNLLFGDKIRLLYTSADCWDVKRNNTVTNL